MWQFRNSARPVLLSRWLQFEVLETRTLLATMNVLPEAGVDTSWPAQESPAQANLKDEVSPALYGPQPLTVSDWIVQFDKEAGSGENLIHRFRDALQTDVAAFEIVRGLGRLGLFQVHARSIDLATAEDALANNRLVRTWQINETVHGAAIPDDSDFGSLVGLHNVGQFGATVDADIDAVGAWDITTGSATVVVGVIDSGIDVSHPDLYLNIWINQGEIPTAMRSQLIDVDGDQLITFHDLNSASNASQVSDRNGNGFVDADDLLRDPRWSDGVDTDGNGFIDDFFGWNFRLDNNETFAPNNPSDTLGHGTHVAGIIGASGNNQAGVTGVNWRSSLMSLKFLDQNNQGDLASAIAAINYATMMRSDYQTNVRVLNNSWGQPGSPNSLVQDAINDAGDAGILFVAAAGNGNVLGQGVNNDAVPFYPAGYESANVIAVAASDGDDRLASFSNFGPSTVDVAAPGVAIRSTLPGGRYGEANGTSMATPFVAGTAALVWASQPQATVAEVRDALLGSVDAKGSLTNLVSSGGRLNALSTLESKGFAPVATIVSAGDVLSAGAAAHEITVEFSNKSGIDLATIGDDDLIVHRRWGNRESLSVALKPGSIVSSADGESVSATYILTPPGGTWDPLDFGIYEVATIAGAVRSGAGGLPIREESIGAFQVRIEDPTVLYVRGTVDSSDDVGSLRGAIGIANANPSTGYTIILDAGTSTLQSPHVNDSTLDFGLLATSPFCADPSADGWSDEHSGDLDILGDVTIAGDSHETTIIDAAGIDRVFKVHAGASLTLQRVQVTGGVAPAGQGGGVFCRRAICI
ncbi:MAG: S8 family peptidase [Pirellulaceae bacterium]